MRFSGFVLWVGSDRTSSTFSSARTPSSAQWWTSSRLSDQASAALGQFLLFLLSNHAKSTR